MARLVFALGISILVGCGSDSSSSSASSGAGTFADVQAVFDASCTSCHGGAHPSAGMSLADGASYDNLVGVPATTACGGAMRVAPSDPDHSCLWQLVSAGTMPRGGTLTAIDKDAIRTWIANGASR